MAKSTPLDLPNLQTCEAEYRESYGKESLSSLESIDKALTENLKFRDIYTRAFQIKHRVIKELIKEKKNAKI